MNKLSKIIFTFLVLCFYFILPTGFAFATCTCTPTTGLDSELTQEECEDLDQCTWTDGGSSTTDTTTDTIRDTTSADEGTRDIPIQLSGAIGSSVRNLPEFIERLYNWAIATAAGVATVMIMIGGFLYLTSAGGNVGKAKEIIGNAVVGLLLVFSAYLILNTISPSILSLELPEIKTIERKDITFKNTVVEDCPDYERAQCEREPRCFWDERQSRCYTLDSDLGINNHGCRTSEPRCNEGLRCIVVNATLIGTGRELCTDGRVGSPCYDNADCVDISSGAGAGGEAIPGFCDDSTHLCLGEGDRPGAAPCSEDDQCASGSCLAGGICASGTGEIGSECSPAPGRDLDDLCGDGIFCCTSSLEDREICGIERPTCIEKFDANHACAEAYQCKSDACRERDGREVCGCTNDYGEDGDAPCPSSAPTCNLGWWGLASTGYCSD